MRYLLPLSFTALLAGLSPAWGQASVTTLDHFKCYQLPAADPLPVKATLQDQFDIPAKLVEQVTFVVPFRVCAPVEKTIGASVTPIINPAEHLDMYLINQQPVIHRRVVVNNQLGTQTLAVGEARILAVPSVQTPSPTAAPPPNLDHYKCYIASGPAINATATLRDEFQTAATRILNPSYFCNPVEKTHNGVVTPIRNPQEHLTCYGIAQTPVSGPVTTTNQFGGIRAPVEPADLLCVPSQKLSWTVVQAQ